MEVKQKQGLKLKLRTKLVLLMTALTGAVLVIFMFFTGYFTTGIQHEANATTNETFSAGSFIINMGVTPQTVGNGLKPYGLIYDLVTNHNTPVKWVIEPTKTKDSADFIYNGISYKGGTFVIPSQFITTAVTNCISTWMAQGVVGVYTASSITVPVYNEIKSFPRILIDNLAGNDSIVTNYLDNAGIPDSAYEIGTPSNLTSCHDIWVNPHGDPTWSTHSPLYNFVTVQKSYIWSQCHAVSMMEYCSNPADSTQWLNYLSVNGLKCYMSGKCGTNPEYHAKNPSSIVNHYHPSDPVMQFMGSMSGACNNGSEKWFMPLSTGGWRSTTKVLVKVGTNPSPKDGVYMVYGPAYGDSTNGLVMYTGGHDMSGSLTDNIAAQRSFFNFLQLAGKAKAPGVTATINSIINANATDTFSVSVTGGTGPYTYQWSSSLGGTFSSPNDSVTSFTAFHTMVQTQTVISCTVTDGCGRRSFFSQPMIINGSALPITLTSFVGNYDPEGNVVLRWATGSEMNNSFFTLLRSKDGKTFNVWKKIPSKGNSTSEQNYVLIDTDPLATVSYYKLTQTDFDGTVTEAGLIKVERLKNKNSRVSIVAGPNPFNDRINIKYISKKNCEAKVGLWNISGKRVREQSVWLKEGDNNINIDSLENLSKGTYILKLYNESFTTEGVQLIKN